MEKKKRFFGFAAAITAVVVWASTYISTKKLILNFSAIEISFVRFGIGVILLNCISTPKFKFTDFRRWGR